jgi:hypothetical protein
MINYQYILGHSLILLSYCIKDLDVRFDCKIYFY